MHYCIRCGKPLRDQFQDAKRICDKCITVFPSEVLSFYSGSGSAGLKSEFRVIWKETVQTGFCRSCGSKWESRGIISACPFCGNPPVYANRKPAAGSAEAPREIIGSGSCGYDVRYTLDTEGTLTISGKGPMTDDRLFFSQQSPFIGNKSIKKAVIIQGVTSISNRAFEGCTGLTGITIPDSVTSIGTHAFKGCTGLTSVIMPGNVSIISECVFAGCTGLTDVTIKYGATSIADGAFLDCTGLTRVVIPDSVTSIGDWAFSGLKNLKDIWIPDNTKRIKQYAFDSCPGLTIHGATGSKAQKYAKSHNIPFSSQIMPPLNPNRRG